jgi:dolichol-phosphate mannosyltransferase
MKIVIVIPTYNEAENIGRLIEALSEEFRSDYTNEYHILVVDGNSPDETAEVVEEKSKKYSFVHLLMEKGKAGLGAAYAYGFKYAMKEMNPDVLMEMDADFQHDPRDVLRLVEGISNGYDYVIGSRFTKGGSIPKEWKFYRKLLSVGGNLFSKIVLGIFSVNDFTSGYKASRVRGFLDKIDLDSILSEGFAYKIDLLFKMHRLGAKIKEVPIKFGLRDRGDSKMERNNFSDSIRVVLSLRFNEKKSFFKFCIVGFAGLAIDIGIFNLLRVTLLNSNTSALVSGLFAMVATFLLNNYWSFKEKKLEGMNKKLISLVVYIISSSIPIFVRSKLVYFANKSYGDTFVVSNLAFFIGIVLGLIWNFTVYSKLIWKGKNN